MVRLLCLAHVSVVASVAFIVFDGAYALSFQKSSALLSSRQCSSWHDHGRLSSAESSSFTSSAIMLAVGGTTTTTATTCWSQNLCLRIPKRSFWFMGKGDGKKKRKKKSAAAKAVTQQQPATPPPQRVSTDINIPVKHQIRWAQMRKAAAKSSGTSFRQKKVVRTRYRRTWDEEEIEIKKQERKRKGQDPDWDVILNQTTSRPLVIVDGYNIIYKWPRLKKHMVKGDTQRARQLLVDDLESLRMLKNWRIECVFDGAGKSTVGPLGHGPGGPSSVRVDRRENKDVSKHGVRVVFTGSGVEADAYIEKRCSDAKNVTKGELTRSFIIATDDNMIQNAGRSAGAMCMSASRFLSELKSVKKATQYRVEAAMAAVNGHAIRPEKLRGTHVHVSTFGRNSVLIEDKRNVTKKARVRDIELRPEDMVNVTVDEDENGVPWWAQVPNRTKV